MTKGAETRERILNAAFRLAARDGLEGLSLGDLSSALGLSKSGLFAHFKSKAELQVDMLKTASARFQEAVVRPALGKPRGLPRIRALMDHWIKWHNDPLLPGGCPFAAASSELDDREGPARDYLVTSQQELFALISRAASIAVEEGHFRRGLDCEQFAFEVDALMLGYNQSKRLMRDPKSERRIRKALEALYASAAAPS